MKFCGAQHNPNALKEDPQLLKFYTGIPDWTVFMALYNLVYRAIPTTPMNKLSKFSVILMFLMKSDSISWMTTWGTDLVCTILLYQERFTKS